MEPGGRADVWLFAGRSAGALHVRPDRAPGPRARRGPFPYRGLAPGHLGARGGASSQGRLAGACQCIDQGRVRCRWAGAVLPVEQEGCHAAQGAARRQAAGGAVSRSARIHPRRDRDGQRDRAHRARQLPGREGVWLPPFRTAGAGGGGAAAPPLPRRPPGPPQRVFRTAAHPNHGRWAGAARPAQGRWRVPGGDQPEPD